MNNPINIFKKNLNFQRNTLQCFFEKNEMIPLNNNGYICCANPRAVIHIFAPGTSVECVYMGNRSRLQTKKTLAKNSPKVYKGCLKCSNDEFNYISHLSNAPKIRCVMMGCHVGRNKQTNYPEWNYLDNYKIDISNIYTDMNNKSLNFEFVITNMDRKLNIRKFDNISNKYRIIYTVKNSIIYLLNFFVEIQSTSRRKYFIEMPIAFKKGSPKNNPKHTVCSKFGVIQYIPKIGSEKAQVQRLMNGLNIANNNNTQLQQSMNTNYIRPLIMPQTFNNKIRLPSVQDILNDPRYKAQYNNGYQHNNIDNYSQKCDFNGSYY